PSMSGPASPTSSPPQPADPLDADALLAALAPDVAARIERLAVFASLDSTNRYLLEAPAPPRGTLNVTLADHQHAGRGRRGRQWLAPPGAGLCLSVALTVGRSPRELLALPLAVGVAVRRAV